MRKLRLIKTSDILRLQGNHWQDKVLKPWVWDPLLREEMSHLPVLSHLSLAPSRSRCPGLELSRTELMRILSWPFSTCKPSVSPLPWSLEHRVLYSQPCHLCRGQTQAITSGSSSLSYPGGHLTFLQREPGNMSHLSACAILWGKNHSHPHGRLRLREARVTQRPEPALLHSRAFCLKDAPQGQVTTGDPWAPGAAGRHWTSSPKRPQFMPCWRSWHTWGERLNRAEHDLASAITSCVISANSLNLSESVLSPAQWS